jgi:hypothetical protein
LYEVSGLGNTTVDVGLLIFENTTPADGETVHVPVSLLAGVLAESPNGELKQTLLLLPATDVVGGTVATTTRAVPSFTEQVGPADINHLNK